MQYQYPSYDNAYPCGYELEQSEYDGAIVGITLTIALLSY